jgi:hypothetical protein
VGFQQVDFIISPQNIVSLHKVDFNRLGLSNEARPKTGQV